MPDVEVLNGGLENLKTLIYEKRLKCEHAVFAFVWLSGRSGVA